MLGFPTLDPFVRAQTRRAAILGLIALVGGYLLLGILQAPRAACESDGVAVVPGGVPTLTTRGQQVVCLGEGLTDPIVALTDSVQVTVALGDGGTVSGLVADEDSQYAIFVREDSSVTINAGATVSTSGDSASAIFAFGDTHTVPINGGTVSAPGAGSAPVSMVVDDGECHRLILGAWHTVTGELIARCTDPFTGTVELPLNGQGAGVFDDDIVGFTSIAMSEAGRRALGADIVNSGSIDIQAGTLALNGTTDSAVTMQSGATLAGSGTVGDIDSKEGSAYQFDLGSTDFLGSTGAVDLFGGDEELDNVAGGGLAISLATPITILSADVGVTGNFDMVNEDLLFLDGTVNHAAPREEVVLLKGLSVKPARTRRLIARQSNGVGARSAKAPSHVCESD